MVKLAKTFGITLPPLLKHYKNDKIHLFNFNIRVISFFFWKKSIILKFTHVLRSIDPFSQEALEILLVDKFSSEFKLFNHYFESTEELIK